MTFEHLKLGHTCVKHKPPHPEFTKQLETRVWDGAEFSKEIRYGGTQKLDGIFAGFRREVGRRPLNTAGSSEKQADRMELLMHQAVRLYQFKYWFGGCDLFRVFGTLYKAEMEAPGSASWSTLSEFKPQLLKEEEAVAEESDASELFEGE